MFIDSGGCYSQHISEKYKGWKIFTHPEKAGINQGAMNQLGLAHNARWIKLVSKSGVDIVDIGIVYGTV